MRRIVDVHAFLVFVVSAAMVAAAFVMSNSGGVDAPGRNPT